MPRHMIINAETAAYITAHDNDDVSQLALKKAPEGVDLPFALTQIDGRQRARKKIPSIAAMDGIIYSSHISMEQCSSETTALYKADIVHRLEAKTLVDLTGGFGIDFIYMSRQVAGATYVERNKVLCDTANENFPLLDIGNAKIVCGDASEYLKAMKPVDIVYLDPARRNKWGKRTFAIGDCVPNVLELLPTLRKKACYVIVKLSPMLDWKKAVNDCGGNVDEVHILSVDDECKELLLVVGSTAVMESTIHCVNLGAKYETFVYTYEKSTPTDQLTSDNKQSYDSPRPILIGKNAPFNLSQSKYLLIPNSSLMKAGCFSLLSEHFDLPMLSMSSHIYLSDKEIKLFPGKCYRIRNITTMNKGQLRHNLAGIAKANIAIRNFPMSANELRRRLKLADGGDTYIFGTTTDLGKHLLFICEK